MSIIDSIQLSGSSYDVRDKSATTVVSLTQQEYDALPSSAKTANILYNITDATAGDLTQYWTSAQTQSAITEAVSGKQETLVSGTNIKTINNESILGSGNIDIQGGGKAIVAGTNISVTTGETADTINCTLNISNGTGGVSIKSLGATSASANHAAAFGQNTKATKVCAFAEGWGTTASGAKSHSEGDQTNAKGGQSHAEGSLTYAIADHSHSEGYASSATSRVTTMVGITTPYGWNVRHSEGYSTIADNGCTHTEGLSTKALNVAEHSSGAYNVSYTASTTWGDSGNTLFSVGNGTSNSARHNAFEIRQNGDIYLTSGSTDIKLQDYLGGGGSSYTAGTGIDITNSVISISLPISAGTGSNSIIEGYTGNTASGEYSHAEGYNTTASTDYVHAEGYSTKASGLFAHAEGGNTSANGTYSHAEGNCTITTNKVEHASGQFNTSNKANRTFGDSGNTLFSVGNGTANNARHNAFEIRQNGDIYISSGGTDIKLQDHLGGGGGITSGEVQTMIDESISGKVNSSDVYLKSETSGATEIATALSAKQDTLVSGTSIKTINNESILGSGNITIQGGGGEVSSAITSGDTNAVAGGAVFDAVVYSSNTYTTELTFDANGYAENWIVGQSAITIDVSEYTSDTSANYYFQNSNGEDLGYAHIYKTIGFWGGNWNNEANNCTITTDGDTATTATITDIPSGTVKIRRMGEMNPPKAIISGDTPETWIKDALDDHRDNTTVHITAAERTSWNNKSNFSGSYNDLTDKPIPDSALNKYSDNPLKNSALFDELRIASGDTGTTDLTITFDGGNSTNYPTDCRQIKVELVNSANGRLIFRDSEGHDVGDYYFETWGTPRITNNLDGSTYELSGSTVIISYPNVSDIARLNNEYGTQVISSVAAVMPNYTYVPVVDQVVANTTALGGLSLVKLTQAQYDALVTKDSNTLYVIVN